MRAPTLLLLLVGLSGCLLASAQLQCATIVDCDECLSLGRCGYCSRPLVNASRCYDKDSTYCDQTGTFLLVNGQCPSQQCSWYKYAHNSFVCGDLYLYDLLLAVITILVTACFAPCIYELSKSPWTASGLDESRFCVFTHEAVDGTKVCARCGAEVAKLSRISGDFHVCTGCSAQYMGKFFAGAAMTFNLLALSIFFFGWLPAQFGLFMCVVVWVLIFPPLLYTMLKKEVRYYINPCAKRHASLIGTGVQEQDLSAEQLEILSPLPLKYKKAICSALRFEERIVWAFHPKSGDVFRHNIQLHQQIMFAIIATVPWLITGILLEIVTNSRASSVLFVFLGVMAGVTLIPSIAPVLLGHTCCYVLTDRRGIVCRRGFLGGTVVASTDYRVMKELTVIVDDPTEAQPSRATGSCMWKNQFFNGFLFVDDARELERLIRQRAQARRRGDGGRSGMTNLWGDGDEENKEGDSDIDGFLEQRIDVNSIELEEKVARAKGKAKNKDKGKDRKSKEKEKEPKEPKEKDRDGEDKVRQAPTPTTERRKKKADSDGIDPALKVSTSTAEPDTETVEVPAQRDPPRAASAGADATKASSDAGRSAATLQVEEEQPAKKKGPVGRQIATLERIEQETAPRTTVVVPADVISNEMTTRPTRESLMEGWAVSTRGYKYGRFLPAVIVIAGIVGATVDDTLQILALLVCPFFFNLTINMHIYYKQYAFLYRAVSQHRYRVVDMNSDETLVE